MSPILHAMFIKPFETEFTRERGKVYSSVGDWMWRLAWCMLRMAIGESLDIG